MEAIIVKIRFKTGKEFFAELLEENKEEIIVLRLSDNELMNIQRSECSSISDAV